MSRRLLLFRLSYHALDFVSLQMPLVDFLKDQNIWYYVLTQGPECYCAARICVWWKGTFSFRTRPYLTGLGALKQRGWRKRAPRAWYCFNKKAPRAVLFSFNFAVIVSINRSIKNHCNGKEKYVFPFFHLLEERMYFFLRRGTFKTSFLLNLASSARYAHVCCRMLPYAGLDMVCHSEWLLFPWCFLPKRTALWSSKNYLEEHHISTYLRPYSTATMTGDSVAPRGRR